jgi:hypothetical protein
MFYICSNIPLGPRWAKRLRLEPVNPNTQAVAPASAMCAHNYVPKTATAFRRRDAVMAAWRRRDGSFG